MASPPPTSAATPESTPPSVNTEPETSSIQLTLDVVGDRWTLLILRALFRGKFRFSEIQCDLGIAKNLLSDRLGRLVDNGVAEKVQYQERPVRFEYHLTEKGRSLSPVLIALMHWGEEWRTDGHRDNVLVHDACGTPIIHSVHCPSCALEIKPEHIQSTAAVVPGES